MGNSDDGRGGMDGVAMSHVRVVHVFLVVALGARAEYVSWVETAKLIP